MSADALAFLDEVAVLAGGDVPDHGRLAELYRHDDRLCVPGTIQSHGAAGLQAVEAPVL